MSSSIPLHFLSAQLESDPSSIGKAGRQSTGQRNSSDQEHSDPIRIRPLYSNVQSSSVDIDNDHGNDNDNANETTSAPGATPHFEEGGYGWVVTGCEQSRQNQRSTKLIPGAFILMFLYAGTLYSWGIFQADLARRQVASALLLSTIGGLQAFCQAVGCMPVSRSCQAGPKLTKQGDHTSQPFRSATYRSCWDGYRCSKHVHG